MEVPSVQSRLNDVMDQLESITDPVVRIGLERREASLRIRIIDKDTSSCKDDISSCNDANEKQLLLQRLVGLENQKVVLLKMMAGMSFLWPSSITTHLLS